MPEKQPKRGRLWPTGGSRVRLRKAIADLTLDKQILAEAARGNY